jgi:hypothetical protein
VPEGAPALPGSCPNVAQLGVNNYV